MEERRRAWLGAQVPAVQDVEDLAFGRPAARRWSHAIDLKAAVGHVGRGLETDGVGMKIAQIHDPGLGDEGGPGIKRRVIVGVDDGGPDRPVI